MSVSRIRTLSASIVAVILALFAAYGLYSLPGLIGRWGVPSSLAPVALAWGVVVALPILLARRGYGRAAIVVALVGTIALRIAMAMLVAGRVPPGDADMYLMLADHLRHGRGLEIIEPYMGDDTRALFPPLYPMLLAGWQMAFGASTAAITALNLIVDGAAALVIVGLGTALGYRRVGRGAAWLYLVWPSVLLSSAVAQKEGLAALLALLVASQWVRFVTAARPGAREAAAIGIAAGLLALTQPGEAPLALLFAIVAIGTGVRRLLVPGLVAIPAAAVAIMLPWWVRNAVVFGTFVPLTSAGGYGLWIGNNPDATGQWMPPPHRLYRLPELAFGHAAARMAVDWIVGHPEGFVRLTAEKALRAWGVAEAGAERLIWMRPAVTRAVAAPLFLVAEVAHLAMLIGAAVGSRVAARGRMTAGGRMLVLLVLACILQTLCFGDLFQFGERHRDFATPFLLLLALAGLGIDRAPV